MRSNTTIFGITLDINNPRGSVEGFPFLYPDLIIACDMAAFNTLGIATHTIAGVAIS
jgi:hypothetical protein